MKRKVLRIFCTIRNALWALEDDGLIAAMKVCDRTAYSLLWVQFDGIPRRERSFRYVYAAACQWSVLLGLSGLCVLTGIGLIVAIFCGFDYRPPLVLHSGFVCGGFAILGLFGLVIAQGVALHLRDRRDATVADRDLW